MSVKQAAQVASHPAIPLMIYDGDCNFCKFWISRWQRSTTGRVEYIASQDPRVAEQFPELPPECFETAVQFIETDGRVYSGAEAVFRSLTYSPFRQWPLWIYDRVPGVAPVTEWAYHFVARRRTGFSFLTRLLWGREGALPTYSLVRWVFLRLMGIIYLTAFVSLGTQILGLVGSHGISPAGEYMELARSHFDQDPSGMERHHALPTLCWFSASDGFLRFLCGAGAVLSILLISNLAPAICLFLLWLIYLSLTSVCGVFLGFQWDALLLETGFLAIFFAPLQIFSWPATASPPSRTILWLLRWLLFRLMFESGAVKLLSGDASWRNLTALNFHYETQPLPTWIGWYAHQLPAGVQTACVFIMFVIELAAPFLIFAPRRLRFFGCWLLVLLQVVILLTGNYCFFNLLTIALCVLLLDDAYLARLIPARWRNRFVPEQTRFFTDKIASLESAPNSKDKALSEIKVPPTPILTTAVRRRRWSGWLTAPLATVIMLVSLTQLFGTLSANRSWPAPLVALEEWISPYRSVNSYGLFAVMTTSRREIIIEGSNDGQNWLPYEFKYKPGDPKRRPQFVAPHQPRLDWQMWFAALGTYRGNPWLVNFCVCLLQGSPEVLGLMGHNPFPNAPPRYIRAMAYEYHFSNFQERRAEGIWWRREWKGNICRLFRFGKTTDRHELLRMQMGIFISAMPLVYLTSRLVLWFLTAVRYACIKGVFLAVLWSGCAMAADWPQFRGPDACGIDAGRADPHPLEYREG